jgi:hypothetical protein
MERLNITATTTKLSQEQKKELAELDSRYAAKLAEREIALKGEISQARDPEKEESLRNQLVYERKKLQAELGRKKNRCEVVPNCNRFELANNEMLGKVSSPKTIL